MNLNEVGTVSGISTYENSVSESEDDNRILIRRAQDLAKPLDHKIENHEDITVLVFSLSGEQYAVEMKFVKEVSLLKSLTILPGTPDFILGIISMRGKIISVTDLRVFFKLPRKGLSDYNKIIVLSDDKMEFAVLADNVNGVQVKDLNLMNPPPPTIHGIGKEYLSGIFSDPLILINTQAILNDTRLTVQRSAIK